MPTTTKIESAGSYERRTAAASVQGFLRTLPRKPVSATWLHQEYLARPNAYPLTAANFGRLLSEMGVEKIRSRAGMIYIPN